MNARLNTREFSLMQEWIEKNSGIRILEEKAYLIETRLSNVLRELGCSTFEDFYHILHRSRDQKLLKKVIDAITTHETLWFRERTPWRVLGDVLLPEYIQELRSGSKRKVRIWSGACSTGQEPYSIAMYIDHYLTSRGIGDITLGKFEILATDISEGVLNTARQGKYDETAMLRGMEQSYQTKYFDKRDGCWEIKPRIRDAVTFSNFNLLESYQSLGKFDLVFMRYVTIYFAAAMKQQVLKKTAEALYPRGVLFLGSPEIFTGYEGHFAKEMYCGGVYYRIKM